MEVPFYSVEIEDDAGEPSENQKILGAQKSAQQTRQAPRKRAPERIYTLSAPTGVADDDVHGHAHHTRVRYENGLGPGRNKAV